MTQRLTHTHTRITTNLLLFVIQQINMSLLLSKRMVYLFNPKGRVIEIHCIHFEEQKLHLQAGENLFLEEIKKIYKDV